MNEESGMPNPELPVEEKADSGLPGSAPAEAPESDGGSVSLSDFGRGTVNTLPRLVSRRWWWVTLLVILGMIWLVRLGFWQLSRLEERRAFNRLVAERWGQQPYDLLAGLPDTLKDLEYRRVDVEGTPDYAHQMVLTNQPGPNGEAGVVLLTPWVMEDGKAVIVARGWVPQEYAAPERWPEMEERTEAPVIGLIQESQTVPEAPPPDDFLVEWYRVDLPLIATQMPYPILPAFVLQLPEEGRTMDQLPWRQFPFELSEGNHLSYAIQWFLFAAILGFGYIQYVRWHELRERRIVADVNAADHAYLVEHMIDAQAHMMRDQDYLHKKL